MSINAADILSVAKSVTKQWERQRKAEERGRSRASRQCAYSDRVNFTDIENDILPVAYDFASGGGSTWITKRQFYYQCRQAFRKRTGRELKAAYFSQNLLVRYMNRHPEAANWKVAADARGNLTIPGAGRAVRIPLGTLPVAEYLRKAAAPMGGLHEFKPRVATEWPSLKAGIRYRDLLYIEKEGFDPLLQQKRIAERFNLAIASGKGQSTAAMRHLADMVCAVGSGCRLLVLHDFDKAGFQIAKRLTTNGDWAVEGDLVKYEFVHDIEVIDLGLRMADVEYYDLFRHEEDACTRSRKCKCYRCQPLRKREYDVSDAEDKYLRTGKRVELNALSGPQFVEMLETKLTALGCHKPLIPDDDTLKDAYARALVVASINSTIEERMQDVISVFGDQQPPKTLRKQLAKMVKNDGITWDAALYALALTKVKPSDDD